MDGLSAPSLAGPRGGGIHPPSIGGGALLLLTEIVDVRTHMPMLRKAVTRRIGRTASEEDMVKSLSGDLDGEFSRTSGDVVSL